ncbi:hypothetical protein, partial [Sphaerochaeta sp. PS]|uniref:hypothetical protein n=1 Tax=Sphaerochaeta sp. PS TaxID=3076336 RepID=UPI0028A3AB3C
LALSFSLSNRIRSPNKMGYYPDSTLVSRGFHQKYGEISKRATPLAQDGPVRYSPLQEILYGT